jgi:hypothetical protein
MFLIALLSDAAFTLVIACNSLDNNGPDFYKWFCIWAVVGFAVFMAIYCICNYIGSLNELESLNKTRDINIANQITLAKTINDKAIVPGKGTGRVLADMPNAKQSSKASEQWVKLSEMVENYNDRVYSFKFAKAHTFLVFWWSGIYPKNTLEYIKIEDLTK